MKDPNSSAQQQMTSWSPRLLLAIKKAYPQLSDKEAGKLAEIMIDEISERIAAGETIGFFRTTPEGDGELTLLNLQILEKGKGS